VSNWTRRDVTRRDVTRRDALAGFAAGAAAWALPGRGWAAGPRKVGMSTALSGPAGFLGRDMRDGVRAALETWPGSDVELVCLDDGYRKDAAERNMQRLIDMPGVLAIIGNVGTPTAKVTVPLANRHGVVMFAPFTGAESLRRPGSPAALHEGNDWVYHYRASYEDEIQHIRDGLRARAVRLEEIVLFIQDDEYGASIKRAMLCAMQAEIGPKKACGPDAPGPDTAPVELPHQLDVITYKRNDIDVSGAALALHARRRPPRIVVMAGTYLPCAKLIATVRPQMRDTLFVNISFVGGSELVQALGPLAEGVVITSTVPPLDSPTPVVQDFLALDGGLFTEPAIQRGSPVTLEGFVAGRLLMAATDGLRATPDRAAVREALKTALIPAAASGLPDDLRFHPETHQASDRVWVNVVRDGHIVGTTWDALMSKGHSVPGASR
jgi:branched-chain amino acid transport system substrate-binding protein